LDAAQPPRLNNATVGAFSDEELFVTLQQRIRQQRRDMLPTGRDERWIVIDELREAIGVWDAVEPTGPLAGTTEALEAFEQARRAAELAVFHLVGECMRYWRIFVQVEGIDAATP
jgi:hypothetical protein